MDGHKKTGKNNTNSKAPAMQYIEINDIFVSLDLWPPEERPNVAASALSVEAVPTNEQQPVQSGAPTLWWLPWVVGVVLSAVVAPVVWWLAH
jgi:hypothetical protein